MNTIQNTTSTMSIVRKAIVLLTIATTLVGASFIGSPAVSAREGSLSTKDGCYIWIGNGSSQGNCLLHNPHYDFNDEILPLGTAYWAKLVENELPE